MPDSLSCYATLDAEGNILHVYNDYEDACKDTDEKTRSIVYISTDVFDCEVIATIGASE